MHENTSDMRTAYSVPGQRHGTSRFSDYVQSIDGSIDLHNSKIAFPAYATGEAQFSLMAASSAKVSPASFVPLLHISRSRIFF